MCGLTAAYLPAVAPPVARVDRNPCRKNPSHVGGGGECRLTSTFTLYFHYASSGCVTLHECIISAVPGSYDMMVLQLSQLTIAREEEN